MIRARHMQRVQRVRHGAIGLLLLGLGGCIAPDLDPTDDFKQASSLVAERSEWKPSWNAPWADDTTTWDGHSPLTVTQAVTIALQNNRSLRTDLEGIAGAKADLCQSGLLPNPVLSASWAGTHVGGITAFSLVQELTQIWLQPEQKDASAMALRSQVQTASDHALRLVADVRNGHSKVVFGQRGVAIAEANIALIERAIAVAKGRVDAGEGTLLDVNRLREDLLSSQADLESQKLALLISKRDLLAQLGMAAADAEWEAAEDARLQDPGLPALTETDAVARAANLRLDVQAARSIFEQRRHEVSVATRSEVPDISLGANVAKDQDSLRSHGYELDVELPIFDTKQVGVAKAESDLRAAAASAEQVLQVAIDQTRTAWLTLQTNLHLATFFREQVLALAKENMDVAQQSFDAGEVDVTAVIDTQRELSDAQSRLNDLELNVATSVSELEYVVGGKL